MPQTEIDAIRREGLTGRQLRLARRVAQKHDLPATSDFDAVRLLRRAGIDPFQRTTMLELVTSDGAAAPAPRSTRAGHGAGRRRAAAADHQADASCPRPSCGPSRAMPPKSCASSRTSSAAAAARSALLAARLFFFVLLPTLLAG